LPYKPKRPCSYPGCPKLTEGRFCEEHQKTIDDHYNKYERDPATRKHYGRRWKRIRSRLAMAASVKPSLGISITSSFGASN
jgi:5-methylcytosine-specific restriction protein A